MAEHYQFTPEQQAAWDNWVATRPPVVQDLCRRFPPNKLFLLKSSGHRVYPVSYSEDGTLKVAVSKEYNLVAVERNVFGISPDDLEECELPAEGEPVGLMPLSKAEMAILAGNAEDN